MKNLIVPILLFAAVVAGCGQTSTRSTEQSEGLAIDADHHILMAEISLERRQFDVAATEYYRALLQSDNPELFERANRIIYDFGTYDQALDAAMRWSRFDETAVGARHNLVLLYLQQGEVRKAMPHLRYLYERADENSERGFSTMLPLLAEARDQEAATEAMKSLAKTYKKDDTSHYVLAFLALRSRDIELATAEARIATENEPEMTEAAVLYARCLLADGQTEMAFDALSDRPGFRNDATMRLEYAILQLAVGRPEEARLELELLLNEYPRMAGALRTLGFVEFQEGNNELAERYFAELLATGSYMSDALFYLGAMTEEDGDVDGAMDFYTRVTSGNNAITARIRLSLILYRLGRPDDALRQLEQHSRSDPETALDLAAARAELLTRMERYDEALKLYDQKLLRYPGDESLLYSRSFLYEQMGRVDDAIAELQALLERNPDDPVALNALGYTLADRTTRYEEAERYVSRALQQSPNSPAIVDSMGWVQFRLGNFDQAVEYLQKAWLLDRDPEIAAHLGEVYWAQGRQDDAKEIWYESLEENPDSEELQEVVERLLK
jgi:tetratricopeptide (TPR) repeat protein